MKKLSIFLVFILALTFTLVGCATKQKQAGNETEVKPEGNETEEPVELVISTWGFNEDLFKKNVYEPFEKEYNVKIVTEIGNNTDRLNKIRQGTSNVDVIYLSDYYAMQGIQEGLFEKINRENIPNIDNLYDIAKAPLGEDYGPAHTITQFGIVYNEALVDTPVESWSDLWNPEFKGKLTLPDITLTSGPMVVDFASKVAGAEDFDEDKAFAKLKEINPNVLKYYSKSSEVVNMFGQGEVAVAAVQDFAYGSIVQAVPTVK